MWHYRTNEEAFSRWCAGAIDGFGDFPLSICAGNQLLECPMGVFFWHQAAFQAAALWRHVRHIGFGHAARTRHIEPIEPPAAAHLIRERVTSYGACRHG